MWAEFEGEDSQPIVYRESAKCKVYAQTQLFAYFLDHTSQKHHRNHNRKPPKAPWCHVAGSQCSSIANAAILGSTEINQLTAK